MTPPDACDNSRGASPATHRPAERRLAAPRDSHPPFQVQQSRTTHHSVKAIETMPSRTASTRCPVQARLRGRTPPRTMLSMNLGEYLTEHDDSRTLFAELRRVILALGPVTEHESKSQVAYRGRRTFAVAWAPGQYLGERRAPLVLSLALPERDADPRWKEVVEPRPGVFMHHLELRSAGEIDDQVKGWISRAYAAAQ